MFQKLMEMMFLTMTMGKMGPVMTQTGMGRLGGTSPGSGPAGVCFCPSCGTAVSHRAGVPCYDLSCPKCDTKMVKGGAFVQQVKPWIKSNGGMIGRMRDLLFDNFLKEMQAFKTYLECESEAANLGYDDISTMYARLAEDAFRHISEIGQVMQKYQPPESMLQTQWPATVEDVERATNTYREMMLRSANKMHIYVENWIASIPKAVDNYRRKLMQQMRRR